MYGIINKSIQELVEHKFGVEVWLTIKKKSKIDIDFFLSNEPYDDEITYQLASATAEELNISVDAVLETFGEWWVMDTTQKKYPGMVKSGGKNLREFLINMPHFHNRVMLVYPKLSPPEFKVSEISDNGLNLHYFSHRPGLAAFVQGVIQGLSLLYETPVVTKLIKSRIEGDSHEIFNINW